MDKVALLDQIRTALQKELEAIAASAADAASAATHEESKPESQYDTRGLEASYLAGAQAGRVQDLAHRINALEYVVLKNFDSERPIGLTAVVTLDDGETQRKYFLFPDGGGLKLELEGEIITVLTPKSPIGRALLEKLLGDEVRVTLRRKVMEMEIAEVF